MEEMCIKCRKKPVYIKVRKLCRACYEKSWREEKGKSIPKRYFNAEIEFIKNFFKHNNWLYEPAIFRLSESNYEPDFYDGERNVFIEVAGTRQAFHRNKEKHRELIKRFPKIGFEVRYSDGRLLNLGIGSFNQVPR